jgi:hypothetical protein
MAEVRPRAGKEEIMKHGMQGKVLAFCLAARSEERATMQRLSALAFLAIMVAATLRGASGCVDWANDCRLNNECCPDGTMSCFAGLDGGPDGTGGMGGGTPAGCIPSENVDPVGDACGVFVSSSLGDDGNTGTKEKPLKTLQAALAKGKPVYACGEGFSEAVSIAGSATLYGALDCANGWAYAAGTKTALKADADAIPLTVSKAATSAEVNDFAITAADAANDGGSSIAVLVAQAAVSFTRCDVAAGNGKAGVAGAAFGSTAQAGADGKPGADACAADMSFGGKAVTNTCGGGDSTSGSGGIGDAAQGGDGSDGQPGVTTNGGKGEGAAVCQAGTDGDPGIAGVSGPGAATLGTLSASGYSGDLGGDGKPGAVAQGGGGGGGAKGGAGAGKCASAASAGGASGGSGGSGGCGGLGGKGGAFGGASLALVSIGATLSFANVTLKVGSGGNGGDGGLGQSGGDGGGVGAGGKAKPTYANLNDACSGGHGGKGGAGGKGGGGTGGHAVAIGVSGGTVPMSGWTAAKGTAGAGGKGDSANGNLGDGAPGVGADCWDFAANAACK